MGSKGQIVEIDETRLGGRKLRKGNKAGVDNKITVLGIAERNGRVHLQKISNVKAATLRPILNEKLSPNAKEFVTDSGAAYGWILPTEKHTEVSHRKELMEQGELSNRTIEGAFSLFKRGVVGSFTTNSAKIIWTAICKSSAGDSIAAICNRSSSGTLLRELVTKKPMTYKTLTREVF